MSSVKQIALLGAVFGSSAILGSLLISVCFIAFLLISNPSNHFHFSDFGALVFVIAVTCVISIPASIVFGIPVFFLLKHFDCLSGWSICVIGLCVGTLISRSFTAYGFPWDELLGLLSSFIAWRLLVRYKFLSNQLELKS